jgi:hypothetical protein
MFPVAYIVVLTVAIYIVACTAATQEEPSLLSSVTRKRLVKANWEDLTLVICKVCELAIAL